MTSPQTAADAAAAASPAATNSSSSGSSSGSSGGSISGCGVNSRKILLPVDGSKHSDRAVAWFLGNLYRPGDFAILTFVLEPPQCPPTEPHQGGSAFVREGNQAYNEGLKEAARLRGKFYQACRDAGVPDAELHFQELIGSKAGETLIRYIEEAGVSCVVIGSRGLGKLRRTFLGSVSDHILHHANCPVVICPDRKNKDKEKACNGGSK